MLYWWKHWAKEEQLSVSANRDSTSRVPGGTQPPTPGLPKNSGNIIGIRGVFTGPKASISTHPSAQRMGRFRSLSGSELLGPRRSWDWGDPHKLVTPSPAGRGQMSGTWASQALGWWQGSPQTAECRLESGSSGNKMFCEDLEIIFLKCDL